MIQIDSQQMIVTLTGVMEDLEEVTAIAMGMIIKEIIMTQMMDKAIIEAIREVIIIPTVGEIPVDTVVVLQNFQEVAPLILAMAALEFQTQTQIIYLVVELQTAEMIIGVKEDTTGMILEDLMVMEVEVIVVEEHMIEEMVMILEMMIDMHTEKMKV